MEQVPSTRSKEKKGEIHGMGRLHFAKYHLTKERENKHPGDKDEGRLLEPS